MSRNKTVECLLLYNEEQFIDNEVHHELHHENYCKLEAIMKINDNLMLAYYSKEFKYPLTQRDLGEMACLKAMGYHISQHIIELQSIEDRFCNSPVCNCVFYPTFTELLKEHKKKADKVRKHNLKQKRKEQLNKNVMKRQIYKLLVPHGIIDIIYAFYI